MSVTAQEVYSYAMSLIDETDEKGEPNPTADTSYRGKAPILIDMLQRDLAKDEGITVAGKVTALTASMQVSDDTALRVLPWGLAAELMLGDNDPKYNDLKADYERKRASILATESEITDAQGVLTGLSTRQDAWV